MDDTENRKFKKVIEYLFDKNNIIKYIKDMSNPSDPTNNIVDLQTNFYFEVGGTFNRLHAHGYVDLSHTGLYQVQQGLVRGVLNQYLDSKVHFSISAQKTAARIQWEKYIKKNQQLPK